MARATQHASRPSHFTSQRRPHSGHGRAGDPVCDRRYKNVFELDLRLEKEIAITANRQRSTLRSRCSARHSRRSGRNAKYKSDWTG